MSRNSIYNKTNAKVAFKDASSVWITLLACLALMEIFYRKASAFPVVTVFHVKMLRNAQRVKRETTYLMTIACPARAAGIHKDVPEWDYANLALYNQISF